MTRLHVVDSSLRNKRGHHFEYTKSVVDEWSSRGGDAVVYCHREAEAEIVRALGANRVFSRDIYAVWQPLPLSLRLGFVLTFLRNNLVFQKDLRRIPIASFADRDIVLVHTIGHTQLLGLLGWYRLLPRGHRPRLVVVLRYDIPEGGGDRWVHRFCYGSFFRLASSLADRKIFYASDSESLAEMYAEMAQARVQVLPIPHLTAPDMWKVDAAPRPKSFAYIGDAREEKGYHLLPGMIDEVLRAEPDVRFVIQSNLTENITEEIARAAREIREFPESVEVAEGTLGSDEYYRILAAVEGVLILYDPKVYRRRTSGIFAEALAFGKSVVVPKDTWMELEFVRFGASGASYQGATASALARAVLTSCSTDKSRAESTRVAAAKWRQFHSPATYVDLLLAMTKAVCMERGGVSV